MRIREVQGAICVASLFQVFIGFTGIMGLVLRYFFSSFYDKPFKKRKLTLMSNFMIFSVNTFFRWITPLTITPAVAMIGLSLFEAASYNAEKNWGIAIM